MERVVVIIWSLGLSHFSISRSDINAFELLNLTDTLLDLDAVFFVQDYGFIEFNVAGRRWEKIDRF